MDSALFGDKTLGRTFVLISNVPPRLTSGQLKQALRDQTTGYFQHVMLTTPETPAGHFNDGYALALFASGTAAVEASELGVEVTPRPAPVKPAEPGAPALPPPPPPEPVTLTLTPIRHREVHELEATYKPTITVEGEKVEKTKLAVTIGLQRVLTSGASPRWCDFTRRKEDCPRGMACKFLHLSEFQKTSAKRGGGGGGGGEQQAQQQQKQDSSASSSEQLATQGAVVGAIDSAVPALYRPKRVEYVDLPRPCLEALLADGTDVPTAFVQSITDAIAKVSEASGGSAVMVRLDVTGGTPSDAAFSDTDALLAQCPTSSQSFNTPLDRDVYLQKVVAAAHAAMAVSNGQDAISLLRRSSRVQDALQAVQDRARDAGRAPTNTMLALARLAVLPLYRTTPVPYGSATVFVKQGEVYAVVQREADLLAAAVRPQAGEDLPEWQATQRAGIVAQMEKAAARWLHRFAVSTKLHMSLAGRAADAVAVTVALPQLQQCTDCWMRGEEAPDDDTLAREGPLVVATGVHDFEQRAEENTMFPPARVSEGEVRWRLRRASFTQHLPREQQALLKSLEKRAS